MSPYNIISVYASWQPLSSETLLWSWLLWWDFELEVSSSDKETATSAEQTTGTAGRGLLIAAAGAACCAGALIGTARIGLQVAVAAAAVAPPMVAVFSAAALFGSVGVELLLVAVVVSFRALLTCSAAPLSGSARVKMASVATACCRSAHTPRRGGRCSCST